MNIVAFSGGGDSTAMALRMSEIGDNFALLFTATGNELPEVTGHIARVVEMTGAELFTPPGPSLDDLIRKFSALPNHRQRWCTRMIKIVPCVAWLKAHPGSVLCVGLRADEMQREGLYGDYATYRYPLREWGWDLTAVQRYLTDHGISLPERTDCAVCPYQRLSEWYELFRQHPDQYAKGEAYEALTQHTFRSASRDTWPAALRDLRAEFERGRIPKPNPRRRLPVSSDGQQMCLICSK